MSSRDDGVDTDDDAAAFFFFFFLLALLLWVGVYAAMSSPYDWTWEAQQERQAQQYHAQRRGKSLQPLVQV